MNILCFLVILLSSYELSLAVKFTRCRLAVAVDRSEKISRTFLSNWVCLIEQVSSRDTSKVTESGGKKSYGLYQIPSRWCKEGRKGGDCDIACESLIDDNIVDDTECAAKIFDREGLKYWPLWETRCKGQPLLDTITADVFRCPGIN